MTIKKRWLPFVLALGAYAQSSTALVVSWANWTSAGAPQTSSGQVSGTVGGVRVDFAGTFFFAQLAKDRMVGNGANPGTNYWTQIGASKPYTGNAVVANVPTPFQLIALDEVSTNRLTFLSPVKNPVMAILSMGQSGEEVTYNFDRPFKVLSEGQGYWGDGSYTVSGNSLTGRELHGVIQFEGAVSEITWTSNHETWHGFTIGVACDVSGTVFPQQIHLSNSEACGDVGPRTPTWGEFGSRSVLKSDAGDQLELTCEDGGGTDYFALHYTPPGHEDLGGTRRLKVGMCPFGDGCNTIRFSHTGVANPDRQPACFVQTDWVSRDYGADDSPNPWAETMNLSIAEPPNVLSHAQSIFDVPAQKLTYKAIWYDYLRGPPVDINTCDMPAERLPALGMEVIDPPLGPETEAFFDTVVEFMQLVPKPRGPMQFRTTSLADLNGDGTKDLNDFVLFQRAFGSCFGNSRYNPAANFDDDDCVTFDDYRVWLDFFYAQQP